MKPPTAWLETTSHRAIDALVLERLVASARVVLDRTRGRVVRDDAAALEVLLDLGASLDARRRAARRLGWREDAVVRAAAVAPVVDDPAAPRIGGVVAQLTDAAAPIVPPGGGGRVGVGSARLVLDAGQSWREALVALRFAADGTADDPGPRTLSHADLGGLALLADVVGPTTPPHPDTVRLDHLARTLPWALETLELLASTASLRAASTAGHVHHSTMQARVSRLDGDLGWGGSLAYPSVRLRIQVALALRRLHRHR